MPAGGTYACRRRHCGGDRWRPGALRRSNQVPPETNARRFSLILGMCGFLTCAPAIPGVFATNGVAFGLGFLMVTVAHSALYALLHGRYVLSFALTNVLAALCVTAAGTVSGRAAEGLWPAADVGRGMMGSFLQHSRTDRPSPA
ncbi:low temperature requirement protein A [Streptomyces sp. HUAS TT7]|uniref:low temperature requirement protein A n=1 Tax=Streptomyces sp. HUAS TT7 TaxID=3447507 RepID=UPI003F658FFE